MGSTMRRGACLTIAAAVVLAGCGGAKHKTSSTSSTSSTAATRSTVAKVRAAGKTTSTSVSEEPSNPAKGKALDAVTYHVTLKQHGAHPGAAALTGNISLRPGSKQVCWRFGRLPKVSVSGTAFGTVRRALVPTSASIYQGSKRAPRGPAVAPLGAGYRRQGCTGVPPSVLNAIRSAPSKYYVEVLDAAFPGAGLRAQL
jgi:hypothetical protein